MNTAGKLMYRGISLDINKIVILEANINYTIISLENGKKNTIPRTLKHIHNSLSNYDRFVRISRSLIINVDYINSLSYPRIILNNGEVYTPSRRYLIKCFRLIKTLMAGSY